MHADFWKVSAHQKNPKVLCYLRPFWENVEQTEDAWEHNEGTWGLAPG